MTSTAEEVLVELLSDLEDICQCTRDEALLDPAGAALRRRILEAACLAQTRLEKVRVGIVAA